MFSGGFLGFGLSFLSQSLDNPKVPGKKTGFSFRFDRPSLQVLKRVRGRRFVAGQRKNRFYRFVGDRKNRKPLIVLGVMTVLLILAIANLMAVAEDPVIVEPERYREAQWSLGAGADGAASPPNRMQWDFAVDPGARRVVDLELLFPLQVEIDHGEGNASFSSLLVVLVEGEIWRTTHQIRATPARGGTAWTHETDLGDRLGRLVIEREPEQGPMLVQVTWDWSHAQEHPEGSRFDVSAGPMRLDPVYLGGLAGCSHPTCAQILMVAMVIGQGAAMFWVLNRYQASAGDKDGDAPSTKQKDAGGTDKKK